MRLTETAEVAYPDLDPRVRVFRHGGLVDTAAILTRRFLVLIDTGVRPQSMAEVMAMLQPTLEGRLLLVVNTHGDWDHVWGNSLFLAPNAPYPAPVIGSRLSPEAIGRERESDLLASLRKEHPGVYDAVEWYAPS